MRVCEGEGQRGRGRRWWREQGRRTKRKRREREEAGASGEGTKENEGCGGGLQLRLSTCSNKSSKGVPTQSSNARRVMKSSFAPVNAVIVCGEVSAPVSKERSPKWSLASSFVFILAAMSSA